MRKKLIALIVITVITTLFNKPSWIGDIEWNFWSSNQAATCHLPFTHGEDFTLPLLYLNVTQGSCKYQFLLFWA